VTLTVPPGAYQVRLPSVTVEGVRYVGRTSRGTVVVRRDRTSGLLVRYLPDGGARQLRATAVGQTGLTLSWTAPPGAQFRLRRAAGDVPVARRWRGVPVPVNGTSAVDKGRQPGKQYSYSLCTRLRGRWIGPLVVVAGTRRRPGPPTPPTSPRPPRCWPSRRTSPR